MPPRLPPADDLPARVLLLEEQMRANSASNERQDGLLREVTTELRQIATDFREALDAQGTRFQDSLEKLSSKFASREDMAMVKGLVLAGVGALCAFAFHKITGTTP